MSISAKIIPFLQSRTRSDRLKSAELVFRHFLDESKRPALPLGKVLKRTDRDDIVPLK